VIVLDGATQAFALERSGAWIAEEVGSRLAAGLDLQPDVDLKALLRQVIESIVNEHDLVPGEAPSTTVSIARFNESTLDVLVLCDSPAVVRRHDGEICPIVDDRLERVAAGIRRPSGRPDLTKAEWVDRVREFESYRNQPDGFWCVSASPEAAGHAVVAQFNRDQVETVLMMTDGVSAVVDSYQVLPGWAEAIHMARSSPRALIDFVHETELGDPRAVTWPRGKIHDDKAVAVITTTEDGGANGDDQDDT
jgi:hypothetical protein